MIEFFKLAKLPHRQKLKKVIKIFEQLEVELHEQKLNELLNTFYLKQLVGTISNDLNESLAAQWNEFFLANSPPSLKQDKTKLRLINATRHYLYSLTGESPSEWDLIMPLDRQAGSPETHGKIFPHLYVYLEDIRSPFNVGSIFRTADAFGVEKIFLSPDCAKVENVRAKRSAMGAIDFVSHEKKSLGDVLHNLPQDIPILALETGGTDIDLFQFPQQGIVLVGSEELGLSAQSLALATERVSIKMYGIKASLNVGVAFGIFMQRWTLAIGSTR